jgi:hypothetical protein
VRLRLAVHGPDPGEALPPEIGQQMAADEAATAAYYYELDVTSPK